MTLHVLIMWHDAMYFPQKLSMVYQPHTDPSSWRVTITHLFLRFAVNFIFQLQVIVRNLRLWFKYTVARSYLFSLNGGDLYSCGESNGIYSRPDNIKKKRGLVLPNLTSHVEPQGLNSIILGVTPSKPTCAN